MIHKKIEVISDKKYHKWILEQRKLINHQDSIVDAFFNALTSVSISSVVL